MSWLGCRGQPTAGSGGRKVPGTVASGPLIGYDDTMTFNQVTSKRDGHECPSTQLQAAWIEMAATG